MKWERFNGDYDKQFYAVRLRSGVVIQHCWPNAGVLNTIDGSGRSWSEDDLVDIAPCQCGHYSDPSGPQTVTGNK